MFPVEKTPVSRSRFAAGSPNVLNHDDRIRHRFDQSVPFPLVEGDAAGRPEHLIDLLVLAESSPLLQHGRVVGAVLAEQHDE